MTVQPVASSSFAIFVLKLPGNQVSLHLAIYLPTSGHDSDFINELTSLRVRLEELLEVYPKAPLFIRGDSNVNSHNSKRVLIFQQFCTQFKLKRVSIEHPTYHHFVGNGKHDSHIDVLLHSTSAEGLTEELISILCIKDNPLFFSHHDMILSSFFLPSTKATECDSAHSLPRAPRLQNNRQKVIWSEEGIMSYSELVQHALQSIRNNWYHPDSRTSVSILLELTNFVLNKAASLTNKTVSLAKSTSLSKKSESNVIRAARRKVSAVYKKLVNAVRKSSVAEIDECNSALKLAKKHLRRVTKIERLKVSNERDAHLHNILSTNPSSVFKFIKNCKGTNISGVERLTVGDDIYLNERVPDGFYTSMTTLKYCDFTKLRNEEPLIAEQFSNYEHILKLISSDLPIAPISSEKAVSLLHRIKKDVRDFYSITARHYIYAGVQGICHFRDLLNLILTDVSLASLNELNTAHGHILYKGHMKDKTSDRSYRTISSCPFMSKALDLYLRDIYQNQWNEIQASTQYQGSGSSHEIAALLTTEVIQYSHHIRKEPVYLLLLDAKSAFDRCLRQILVCELFKAGVEGDALKFINNRLSNRLTVYEWNSELLGPSEDITGFEQGGINSSDYYKLYNNDQLKAAQASHLGVHMGISHDDPTEPKKLIVSAIGQADDVVLVSNDLGRLGLLAYLSEEYCRKYNVTLVPSKTNLLAFYPKGWPVNPDLISNVVVGKQIISFSQEADHVGITRNTAGNLAHITNRISAYKRALFSVLSVGIARNNNANTGASMRIHQLYAVPVLFSGLASLCLIKKEVSMIESAHLKVVQNLMKLHDKTPRCFTYLVAGCLPAEAVLHQRQLTLFLMVCHLRGNPLNEYAVTVLTNHGNAKKSWSWFQQIRELCLRYGLLHPLQYLKFPPERRHFKNEVKNSIILHWQSTLRSEAAMLQSLSFFTPSLYTLNSVHPAVTAAGNNPYECKKTEIMLRMQSGRYRTEQLTRHWAKNSSGFCSLFPCREVGVTGDLEHMLLHCPAMQAKREASFNIMVEKSSSMPHLVSLLTSMENAEMMKFLLEPLSMSKIVALCKTDISTLDHVYYLARTYVYNLHLAKLEAMKTN